jgi:hypothetical protein
MRSMWGSQGLGALVFILGAGLPVQAAGKAIVVVSNNLALARPSETVVLDAKEVARLLAVDDVRKVHVTDSAGGKELLTQAIDLDGDDTMDQLLFQLDLGPRETRRLTLTVGERRLPKREEFKVFGRFVRERFDDFAWENDRVAHRMYGKGLETWQKEPLTSSTVDVWCKKTRRLVVNDWYMVDDYHRDTGEGADFYSAGKTRGCGGNGLWVNGRLWTSKNFVQSKVIAAGPIRLVFELVYEPWEVAGKRVAEVKRVTLDAGQHFNRFESNYLLMGAQEIVSAAGLRRIASSAMVAKKEAGWIRTWETVEGGNGGLGLALVFDPATVVEVREEDPNYLVVLKAPAGQPVVYYAGSAWDKAGDFADAGAWEAYVDACAQRVRSPIGVKMTAE